MKSHSGLKLDRENKCLHGQVKGQGKVPGLPERSSSLTAVKGRKPSLLRKTEAGAMCFSKEKLPRESHGTGKHITGYPLI